MRRIARSRAIVALMAAGLSLTGCSLDTTDDPDEESTGATDESSWRPAEQPDKVNPRARPTGPVEASESLPDAPLPPDLFGDPLPEAESPDGYEVHEWGTFTSVQSSDGDYLPGLHHEEESLPGFVHQFAYRGVGDLGFSKGIPRVYLPEPVTQKLETPVIYFYTERDRQIDVSVDFPDGYITEWYPDSVDQMPERPERGACARLDCSDYDASKHGLDELADGSMTWSVDVTNEDRDVVGVPPEDIWAPSREVPDAAFVEHADEAEKFIFYRGVGQFEPPFQATAEREAGGERIDVTNQSDETIPHAWIMKVHEDGGKIRRLGALEPGESDGTTFVPAPKEFPKPHFAEHAKRVVRDGLVQTGLTVDEAEAMVDTWEESYFKRNGHRVLYVLPRAWTDRMLPMSIEPAPDELVRTIVGRVEVLTPEQEEAALQEVEQAHASETSLKTLVERGGRFDEPLLHRACQLVESAATATWCRNQVARISGSVIYEARDHR